MALQHVVVDGSNIATEGRSVPSLRQLDEAVTAFLEERGDVELTVVVDATFGHRISDDEKAEYEDAILNGELVTPPAGAIGRGDAFVLQIADKAKASVFSNDSFQEFHGSYEWLFDEGRLIGGKPVRNVGWVFVLRNPVRGPTSRRATREARTPAPPRTSPARVRKSAAKQTTPASSPDTPSPSRSARRPKPAEAVATMSRPENDEDSGHGRRRRSGTQSAEPINEPLPFLEFVGAHPLGSQVEGTVDRFSSHGAYVLVDGTHCYIPLKALSDPPPTSAREVLELGQVHSFVVQSFDSARRGVDLALLSPPDPSAPAPPVSDLPIATQPAEEAPGMAAAKKTTAKKTTATKSAAKKSPAKAVAKKATSAVKKTAAATKSVAKKATTAAKKTTAGKAAAKKTTAKKTTVKKTAAATKTTAKKTAATTKAPAKKTTTAKAAATRKAAPRKTAANT